MILYCHLYLRRLWRSFGVVLLGVCIWCHSSAWADDLVNGDVHDLPAVTYAGDASTWAGMIQPSAVDGVFYGGAEIIFFKPFGEAGTTPQQAIAASAADSFLPAWRIWGGLSDADGLGARLRWWQYDQFSGANDGFGTTQTRLIFQKLDVEATQQLTCSSWDLMLSAGMTWIGNELDLAATEATEFDRWRMDAVGVTAGIQAVRRSRRFEHWRWFGSAQGSGVFGNSLSQTVADPIGSQPSTVGGILEFVVGPRWEREIGGGATAFAGGNAEAQYWMTGLGSLEDGVVPDGQGAVGLVGLSFNVGIRR